MQQRANQRARSLKINNHESTKFYYYIHRRCGPCLTLHVKGSYWEHHEPLRKNTKTQSCGLVYRVFKLLNAMSRFSWWIPCQVFELRWFQARERDATTYEKRMGMEMSESLRKLIEPYFLRRTKAMVLEKKNKNPDEVDGSEESDKENKEGSIRR